MALSASPPPHLPSAANDLLLDQLDDDIAKVRAEIANLTKRRSLLSASLLSSSKVQTYLRRQTEQSGITGEINSNSLNSAENNPLQAVDLQSQFNKTNIHRLAFGVTSFPFVDPNPETSDEPLLGIRFDIPSHNGKFEQAPYYIFCKKTSSSTSTSNSAKIVPQSLTVHHHTIPAFIPLQDLIDTYLPPPPPTSSDDTTTTSQGPSNNDTDRNTNMDTDMDTDMDMDSESSNQHPDHEDNQHNPSSSHSHTDTESQPTQKQNLHALTTAIHTALQSHSKRKAAINLLSQQTHLHPSVTTLSATGEDCRFVRLIWRDGLVGRIKIDDEGQIDKVVVFGEEGRMRDVERLVGEDGVSGKKVHIMNLNQRFEEIAKKRNLN